MSLSGMVKEKDSKSQKKAFEHLSKLLELRDLIMFSLLSIESIGPVFTHVAHQQVNDSESVKISMFFYLLDSDSKKNILLLPSCSFA